MISLMVRGLRPLPSALCSLLYALCALPYALCPLRSSIQGRHPLNKQLLDDKPYGSGLASFVLCSLLSALCSMLYALC
jgi:hypothetical protein